MDKKVPTIAVVGAGAWGANLVRTHQDLGSLGAVCDIDPKRLAKVQAHGGPVRLTTRYEEILEDRAIEGVVLAVPAVKHFEFAKRSLLAGKATYVEKPLAMSSAEAEELVRLAGKVKRPLMVGHLLKYHPAVRKLKEIIDRKELGEIYYAYSKRVNLGQVRRDENALWSFAPHDISLILYLLGDGIDRVSAHGQSYLQKGIHDVVFLHLKFRDDRIAHIHLSWLDPHKERKLTLVGSKKMVTFDDMESAEKLRVYDKGVTVPEYASYGEYLSLRFGDIRSPMVDKTEPLALECRHFLDCVAGGTPPFTGGEEGVQVVRILEKAQESLERDGVSVKVAI